MNQEERKRKAAEKQRERRARPEIAEAHRKERREYYYKNREKVLERQRKNQNTPAKKLGIWKYSATRRNLAIEISDEEACRLWKEECHYCGAINPDKLNSIDRVDNTKGYIQGNCFASCMPCNKMKGAMQYEDFIALCKKIGEKHK